MTGVLPAAGVADHPALARYDGDALAAPATLGGAAARAAAAAQALGRAEVAAVAAVQHLLRAGDVDWAGPGAAAYREDLAAVLDGVRRARARLRDAEAAAGEHAAAVREREALALAAGCPPGFVAPPTGPARELVPWPGTRWAP